MGNEVCCSVRRRCVVASPALIGSCCPLSLPFYARCCTPVQFSPVPVLLLFDIQQVQVYMQSAEYSSTAAHECESSDTSVSRCSTRNSESAYLYHSNDIIVFQYQGAELGIRNPRTCTTRMTLFHNYQSVGTSTHFNWTSTCTCIPLPVSEGRSCTLGCTTLL
jgi:hypothetical protein